MPITDWPQEDKPREKLLHKGEANLTDAELLAVFIHTGIKGKTALDLAKDLLQQHGNLKKLLTMPVSTITSMQGIGLSKYVALKAALELGRRYFHHHLQTGEVLNNVSRIQSFLAAKLQDHANEVFACLFLDNHLRLLRFEELFYGTINEINIYTREIARKGLLHNAANIILAHNHPSGLSQPSEADIAVTEKIKQSLDLIDIKVIDHVIVGKPDIFSFAQAGLI